MPRKPAIPVAHLIGTRKPYQGKFSVADLSDFICEFTRYGKRKTNRDVVQWYRWFERKCGFKESHIFKVLKGGRRVYKKL